jgi:hypothetical protein
VRTKGACSNPVPVFSPEEIGHVSIPVVDPGEGLTGIRPSLWSGVREWFLCQGLSRFELDTECGSKVSGPFWQNRGFEPVLERRLG